MVVNTAIIMIIIMAMVATTIVIEVEAIKIISKRVHISISRNLELPRWRECGILEFHQLH